MSPRYSAASRKVAFIVAAPWLPPKTRIVNLPLPALFSLDLSFFLASSISRLIGVPESLRVEMLEHFTAEQLVELTAGIAFFMGFSKIAVSLGQAPATMPTMVIPTPDWPD